MLTLARTTAALLAGLAMALAFAPYSQWWAAFVSLAVIFALVVSAQRLRVVCLLGASYGLGYAGLGVYWIYYSIANYGGGPVAAVVATGVLVALFALIPMVALLLGWLAGARHRPGNALLALALAWVLVEWIRSWLLTGATWLSVGYSQIDTPLASVAPVAGVYGVGLLLVLIAGGLAAGLLKPLSLRWMAPVLMAAVTVVAALLLDRDWTTPSAEPLRVALIQGNIDQARKWDPNARDAIIAQYREQTEAAFGADLIIWPESALPVVYQDAQPAIERLAARAQRAGSTLMLGAPAADPAGAGLFNAVVVPGEDTAFYYKRHLVPFGEYVPLRHLAGGLLDFVGTPLGDFSAGHSAKPLQVAGHAVGVSICYEITFGAEIAAALPQAQWLLNVSNDAWFGDSPAPWQHLQMSRMRALELGRPLLRATNTGVSAIIDSRGALEADTALFETLTLTGEIEPHEGLTPYARWRDWPVVGVSALGLLVLAATGRRGYRLFRDV
jgi:apolipoprotein N-acyltransferase